MWSYRLFSYLLHYLGNGLYAFFFCTKQFGMNRSYLIYVQTLIAVDCTVVISQYIWMQKPISHKCCWNASLLIFVAYFSVMCFSFRYKIFGCYFVFTRCLLNVSTLLLQASQILDDQHRWPLQNALSFSTKLVRRSSFSFSLDDHFWPVTSIPFKLTPVRLYNSAAGGAKKNVDSVNSYCAHVAMKCLDYACALGCCVDCFFFGHPVFCFWS